MGVVVIADWGFDKQMCLLRASNHKPAGHRPLRMAIIRVFGGRPIMNLHAE
jgi:hypothetical protein